MPRVFVSHSTDDRRFVEERLLRILQTHGIETWYAPEDIQSADEWERRILKGLQECEWFLVVVTPNAIQSDWVRAEVHWAMENRKGRVIPVLLGTCSLSDLHLKLSTIQYVDIRPNTDEAWHALLGLWGKSTSTAAQIRRPNATIEGQPDRHEIDSPQVMGVTIEVPEGMYVAERSTEDTDGEWREVGDHSGEYYFPPNTQVCLSAHDLTDTRVAELMDGLIRHSEDFITAMSNEAQSVLVGPWLSRLDLCECDGLTDASLNSIARATSLSELDLSWTSITDWGLSFIHPLKRLRSISLNGCHRIGDRGIEHVCRLEQLKRLEISMSTYMSSMYDGRITTKGMSHLGRLSRLEFLDLTRSAVEIDEAGIENLEGLTCLRHLDLTGCRRITDLALGILSRITTLDYLALGDCETITDTGISFLSALTNLREIHLTGCKRLTDDSVAVLVRLPHLKVLELNGCLVSDHGLEMIAGVASLRKLSIGSPLVTDQGICFLERLRVLDWLTVDKSMKLTDRAISAIGKMSSLQTVRLFRSPMYSKKAWKKLLKADKQYVYWGDDAEVS